jgi:hypothetical protein
VQTLADLDRPRLCALLRASARAREAAHPDVRSTFERFPKPGALPAFLDGLSFVARTERTETEEPLSVLTELKRRGWAFWDDIKESGLPVSHDLLLYRIARLVPDLSDTLFRQDAPDFDDNAESTEGYTIHAYSESRRFSLGAENHGKYPDLQSCVALVNTVLSYRKSDHRLTFVGTDGEAVLGGTLAGLRGLRNADCIAFSH